MKFFQTQNLVKTGLLSSGLILALSACTTTTDRYARLYDACDQRAGVCFSQCESYSLDQGRGQCQSDCAVEADRCFADISALASRESAYAVSRPNFYGRYGAWYPSRGYVYGPHGYPYGYPSYSYGGGRGSGGRSSGNSDTYEVERSTGKPNNPRMTLPPAASNPAPPPRSTGKPNVQPSKPVTSKPTSKPTPKPSTPKPSSSSGKPPKAPSDKKQK